MGWFYKKTQEIHIGNSWIDEKGTKHSPDWFQMSDKEKKKMGISYVAEPEPFNSEFYHGRDSDGKLIERSLDDYYQKDLDGKDIVDEKGNKVKLDGLKTIHIRQTKKRAMSLLLATDWYVVRKSETGKAIPSDIATYREKVRTESKAIEDKINACSKLSDFISLFETPKSGGNPPINFFS
jgi:hypothetical protein